MKEVWKPVVGFEGAYEVSNLGGVRSLDRICTGPSGRQRKRKGQPMRPTQNNDGHLRIRLCNETGSKLYFVHRLVAEAFCHKPAGCDICNHLDGNTSNNASSNLEWTTVRGNSAHAYLTGLAKGRKGMDHHLHLLSDEDVREIIKRLCKGESHASIARDYPVSHATVTMINKGAQWSHIKVDGCEGYPYHTRIPSRLTQHLKATQL